MASNNMDNSARRWQHQLILVLGLWLIVSPWVFDYADASSLMINAVISGAVMVVLAAFDLYKTYFWAVMVNLLVGLWVATSPWALDAAALGGMPWNELIVGVAVAALALWEMRADPALHKHWPGTDTAN